MRFALVAGSLVSGVAGSRISRAVRRGHPAKRADDAQPGAPVTKLVAGIPVLNYDRAYGGRPALAEDTQEEEWIVVLRPEATDATLQALCQASRHACKAIGHPSSGGVPFVEFRGTEEDLHAVLEAAGGAAKFAEPDVPMYAEPELDEEGVAEASPWGLARIGAPQRSATGRGVNVYILDTGIRASHVDFGGRVVPALDMSSGSAVECEAGSTTCAGDKHSHGTHCAGTAAGERYGVAPEALLRSVKVLGDRGSGASSWTLTGLDWLVSSAVHPAVASMSLGSAGRTSSMEDGVSALVAAGVTVVVAGGNSNANSCNHSPAFVPAALTVGSTTSTDERSWFSNYGPCTNIWAPGSSIVSADVASDTAVTTKSGTSMACPHVAGAAALQLEQIPDLTPNKIRERLLDSSASAFLSDLRLGDSNKLLFVGAQGPPANPSPVPEPTRPPGCPSSFSSGPDSDGDCVCNEGLTCFEGGRYKCTFSLTTSTNNRYHYKWFAPSCENCLCLP